MNFKKTKSFKKLSTTETQTYVKNSQYRVGDKSPKLSSFGL